MAREYRLGSNGLVHAPGVIAYAQALWAEGQEGKALEIISAWPGIPLALGIRLAKAEAETRVEGETLIVVDEGGGA